MQYTVAEYFAGIGLVRLGLERAGWKVVFANDIAPEKYQMYQDAFPDAAQHYRVSDIFDIDPSIVPSTTLATSSFPCIDLSLAGKQNGLEGKHSSAFWGFLRILKYQVEYGIAPPLVLLENVIGWLTSNHGDDFRLTIRALNDLGYSCDVFTLDALRFTPQSRPRVFVVGAQNRPLHQMQRLCATGRIHWRLNG
ncbi:MAG: DNA (cytosine-5-)-methyltransferase [Anaerolineae bacterium]|nr:DNA (cytosine-5-)-methyltransferase [Anaerolineae bacterium]